MRDGRLLAWILADPSRAQQLDHAAWTEILSMAHAEKLLGSLAAQLKGQTVPAAAQNVLKRARLATDNERQIALWEAEMARRALAPLGITPILLKGAALAAAAVSAATGRHIGDLDILVPRDRLEEAEAAILAAGWEWAKPDPYDDLYYRRWMHELPPMIHRERDRMIDVHHTILPLTTRQTPDAEALVSGARKLECGLYVLAPEDMIIHAVAHLFADGDLQGGLRNLWDIDRMIREFSAVPDFWLRLKARTQRHQLSIHLARALRLCHHIFETPVEGALAGDARKADVFYVGKLLARNGWGQETRKLLAFAFYIRSHWIRMPPLLLMRHLWTKWWREKGTAKP
jgi:hypothetical protein